MLQIVVAAISHRNTFKNGYYGIKIYSKPWYVGDVEFWRRRISTDDLH